MIDGLVEDVRYACRQIRRSPGFAFAVIATLALAIGANTALYSLLNAIVIRTLPVADPGRLVLLQAMDERGQQNRPIYYRTFVELAKQPGFETVTLYSGGGVLLTEARSVLGEGGIEAVTPGFHEMLGLRPFLGRYFTAHDAPADSPAAPVAVISHRFWQRYYGADPNAVGERLIVSGEPMTVIGVTPPEYRGLYVDGGFGFSVPLTVLNRQLGTDPKRPVRGLNAVARLKAGVSLAQARAAVEAAWPALRVATIPPGLSPTEQNEIATQRIEVESLARGFSGLRTRYQDPLIVLTGITALLLTIGCVNLSGLLLARTAAREQQLAIRFALGASRGRIVQQLLVESLMLSLIGAAVAVPLAWWATIASGTVLWQSSIPLMQSLTPDARVLRLTALVAIATGLIISILPASSAIRGRPQSGLQPVRTVAHATGRWGRALLVAQVALSMVLLVGAGLFASSLRNLRNIEGGFRTKGVRWSRLFAVPGGYRGQNDAVYYPELVRQLSQVPAVHSVALSYSFPTFFNLGHLVARHRIARPDAGTAGETAEGMMECISPRFFETVGMTLVRGRDFTWSDDGHHPGVTIINESLSRKLFPAGDAIGQRIRVGTDPTRSALEVVGIVSNAAIGDLRSPQLPVVFRPRLQEPQFARAPVLTIRTNADPASVDAAATKVIKSLGHEYPRRFYSLDEQIDLALIQERLLAGLSSFFAGLAVLLAYVGLHGLLAHAVARRTREIGIRMALGASRPGVIRMIVSEGVALTVLGVAIGVPCALAAGRVTASLLFGLAPSDPLTLIAAAMFFVLVGATAGIWPARRASHVEPMTALRCD
jgi:predicted permease